MDKKKNIKPNYETPLVDTLDDQKSLSGQALCQNGSGVAGVCDEGNDPLLRPIG